MSTPSAMGSTAGSQNVGTDWGLIRRQIFGILRLELRNQLLTKRALALYFLAFAPIVLLVLWLTLGMPEKMGLGSPVDSEQIFAFVYLGYLGTSIFLSCLILFMSLFRAEILEKSLHYYFLSPIRREVLVAGKYAAALIAITGVYAAGTSLLYLLTMSPWGLGELGRYLFSGPGLGHLVTYVGIAVLACIGYGAIFELAGLLFKNPVIIGVFLWAWELVNPFAPSFLKKLSVVFYLKSLLPIPPAVGPLAIQADPLSAWVSVPGLLILATGVLFIASWRARAMEISYDSDD